MAPGLLSLRQYTEAVDVLINNAGVALGRSAHLGAMEYDAWKDTLDTNVLGKGGAGGYVRLYERIRPRVESARVFQLLESTVVLFKPLVFKTSTCAAPTLR